MTHDNSLQDDEIIRRLESLQHNQTVYPPGLLEKRRLSFLAMLPALGASIPARGILKRLLTDLSQRLSHLTASALQTILVSVVVVEVGLGLWFLRDDIARWLTPDTPTPSAPLSNPPQTTRQAGDSLPSSTPTPSSTTNGTHLGTSTPTPTGTLFGPTSSVKPGYHLGQTRTPRP